MHIRSLVSIALCVACLSGAGCASLSSSTGVEEVALSDADISHEIQNRLRDDLVTTRQTFGVSVSGGVVTLTGSVKNAQVRARAINIAEGSPGVREVIDRMYR